jgi:hypothetical protein
VGRAITDLRYGWCPEEQMTHRERGGARIGERLA